jgi:hypothetical protein
VSLSDSALLGLAPAPITYQASGLNASAALFVTGREKARPFSGLPDDTFTVSNTPGSTHLGLGKGVHRVNVLGLTGELSIGDAFGPAAQTQVLVGGTSAALKPAGGTLAAIHGLLSFSTGTNAVLVVDDSGDATPRTVNLSATPLGGEITGLAPGATIEYSAAPQLFVQVFAGSGGNTFNVGNTAGFSGAITDLEGGKGNDTFNVFSTTTPLQLTTGSGSNHLNIRGTGPNGFINLHAAAGKNAITVGSLAPALGGTVTNLHGAVFIDEANSSSSLVVDDSGDPAFQKVLLNKGVTSNVINFTSIGPFGVPIDFPGGIVHHARLRQPGRPQGHGGRRQRVQHPERDLLTSGGQSALPGARGKPYL